MNNANPADFSYPVFDRQLKNLLSMSQVLLEGWDDYSTTELNHDLRSLCIKSARICYQADIDRTLQQEAFNRQRLEPNYFFLEQFNDLVRGKLVPHLKATISQIREGKAFQGHTSPLFPISYSKVLPHLSDFLIEDGASVHALDVLQKDAEKIEKVLEKKKTAHTTGMLPEERFMALSQYFALCCYLLLHFEKVVKLYQVEIKPDEAARLFTKDILNYTESEKGQKELERFKTTLEFDYDGEVLTDNQIKEIRRKIRDAIPVNLQTMFMKYADQTDTMAIELLGQEIDSADYQLLLEGLAKWQLLKATTYEQAHPETTTSTLHNTIFRRTIDGSKVNLLYIREVIGHMLPKITRKNHWFCVWCVLKHRNLLATLEQEAFALQMQHPDWFPNLEKYKTFTGATLNDYNGYLSQTDFLSWNEEDYKEFLNFHHVPKQSQGLLKKFKTLCIQLDAAFGC